MIATQRVLAALVGVAVVACAATVCAQRLQFPGAPPAGASGGGLVPVPSFGSPSSTTPLPGSTTIPSTTPLPGATGATPGFGAPPSLPPAGSGATLGAPAWDPYSSSTVPGAAGAPPSTAPWNTMPSSTPPLRTTPLPGAPGPAPYGTQPPGAPGAAFPYGNATAPPAAGYPGYGPTAGQPDALFPNGLFGPNTGPAPLRLLDDLRLRETWTAGGDGLDLGMNDIETGIDFQFPNFFGTSTPLIVSPQFVLSLWDGPKGSLTQQLPPNAYAALVEASWNSDPALAWGANLAGSVGVFSDFNTATTESIRLQTMSYGWVRLTPQIMAKFGVNYIDRLDIKLLPAVGILWEPNPQTRFDIFFPKPKLARQFSTVGTTDVWFYVAGEYGGGSWTIEDYTGSAERIDINDIRLMVGVDWYGQSGMRGMFEVGWVTSREVVYLNNPSENFAPGDTFMLRAGVAF